MEEVGWQVEREQERILGFRTNTMPPTLGKEVRCSEGQSLPFGAHTHTQTASWKEQYKLLKC